MIFTWKLIILLFKRENSHRHQIELKHINVKNVAFKTFKMTESKLCDKSYTCTAIIFQVTLAYRYIHNTYTLTQGIAYKGQQKQQQQWQEIKDFSLSLGPYITHKRALSENKSLFQVFFQKNLPVYSCSPSLSTL